MTIPATASEIGYAGNGVTTVFSIPFVFDTSSDLKVIRENADGSITQLTTGFTVAGGGGSTGTLTFAAAPAAGVNIWIFDDPQTTQPVDYVDNDPFPAESHERALDRGIRIAKRSRQLINRAIRYPDGESNTDGVLPGVDARKGMFLFFDPVTGAIDVAAAVTVTALTQSIIGALLTPRTESEIAAGVTPVNLYELREYIERQGATPSLVASQLTAINNAILANNREIRSHDGEFIVSAAPTNPLGKQFLGTGAILIEDPLGGYQQLNSYADLGPRFVFGKEYLYRIYARIENAAVAPIKTFAYGDSTVATGGSGESAPFYTENLLPYLCRSRGLNREMVLTNRGVSATDVSDLDALPDLAVDTDLFIIKYGINDGLVVGDRLDTFATTLRAKLAAIRAAMFGSEELLSIVLVGPNSTNDSPNERDERWYEQLRNVYIQAARDYKCCYLDTYGMFRDSRSAANLWMDDPFANGIAIHPNDIGRAWIWGWVIDEIFGELETVSWRSNLFHNVSGNYEAPTAALAPTSYPFGLSIRRATVANSWPEEGVVITTRHIDGPALQILHPFAAGRTVALMRVANTGAGSWNLWSGQKVTLTLQNSWVTFGGGYDTPHAVLTNDGVVMVHMIIKDGTTVAGTVISTLPAGMRPTATVGPFVCYTAAGTCSIRIESSGNIIVHTTADAAATALECTFRAA